MGLLILKNCGIPGRRAHGNGGFIEKLPRKAMRNSAPGYRFSLTVPFRNIFQHPASGAGQFCLYGTVEKALGGCPRIAIFSKIKACSKNYRRHIVDIPRIIF